MRFEAIVSKTQRKQACGTTPGSVRASSVRGWDEYGALSRRSFQNLLQLRSTNQGNVAGNDQRAVRPTRLTELCCHFDSIRLAAIRIVGNDLEFESSGQFDRECIACDDADFGPTYPRAQRF